MKKTIALFILSFACLLASLLFFYNENDILGVLLYSIAMVALIVFIIISPDLKY